MGVIWGYLCNLYIRESVFCVFCIGLPLHLTQFSLFSASSLLSFDHPKTQKNKTFNRGKLAPSGYNMSDPALRTGTVRKRGKIIL